MAFERPRVIVLSSAQNPGSDAFFESMASISAKNAKGPIFEQVRYTEKRPPSDEALYTKLCESHVVVSLEPEWHMRLSEIRQGKKHLVLLAAIPPRWLDSNMFTPDHAVKLIDQSHRNEQRLREKMRQEREREMDADEKNRSKKRPDGPWM
ncbi:hypothetical protein HY994_04565 [Candidatus Micrarchaeota archaeon]|nr:hypothetical protein [Candidatus Micrarchaeota archaeon]